MTQVDKILAEIQALAPQERDLLFEKLAGFEAIRLRAAIQHHKEQLSSQAHPAGYVIPDNQASDGI